MGERRYERISHFSIFSGHEVVYLFKFFPMLQEHKHYACTFVLGTKITIFIVYYSIWLHMDVTF